MIQVLDMAGIMRADSILETFYRIAQGDVMPPAMTNITLGALSDAIEDVLTESVFIADDMAREVSNIRFRAIENHETLSETIVVINRAPEPSRA